MFGFSDAAQTMLCPPDILHQKAHNGHFNHLVKVFVQFLHYIVPICILQLLNNPWVDTLFFLLMKNFPSILA